MPVNIKQQIPAPTVPNLPTPGGGYSGLIASQHNGVLRPFFSAVVNALRSLVGEAGVQYLDAPNGLFFDTTSSTLALANTGYPVPFNNTYIGHHVYISEGSKITVHVPGVYNFSYSGQLTSTNSSSKDVQLWLRKNGQDIPYSTHFYTISGSGTKRIMNWLFEIDMQAGDYTQLMWASPDTTVTLTATTAAAPHPGGASSVLSVDYAAPLPDPLPSLPTP